MAPGYSSLYGQKYMLKMATLGFRTPTFRLNQQQTKVCVSPISLQLEGHEESHWLVLASTHFYLFCFSVAQIFYLVEWWKFLPNFAKL